ncbi:MAG: hypothetical protein MHPSP_000069 [Paramarteilia canceri]
MFEELYKEQQKKFLEKQKLLSKPISVTLPDGKIISAKSFFDSPVTLLKSINNKKLAKEAIISKVNGKLWDLEKPLETDCSLEILDFTDPEAQKVFWHSSAHVMGEALEQFYGCHLCFGPPIENGFFYDMFVDKL